MPRSLNEQARLHDVRFAKRPSSDSINQAISGAFTVDPNSPFVIRLDPTGAQNVTLPTKGSRFMFILIHGSTNNADLTIKDSTGSTIGTLSQNEMGWVVDEGNVTKFGMMPTT